VESTFFSRFRRGISTGGLVFEGDFFRMLTLKGRREFYLRFAERQLL